MVQANSLMLRGPFLKPWVERVNNNSKNLNHHNRTKQIWAKLFYGDDTWKLNVYDWINGGRNRRIA